MAKDSGDELVEVGASILADLQQDGVHGATKEGGHGGPHLASNANRLKIQIPQLLSGKFGWK